MKKICITLVVAATLFILSCKKEDNQISNNHNKPNSGISEADAKLERSLQNFISKVKNYNTNNAKTRTASDVYSLDSTEFYLEAGINYLNASNQITYEKQYTDEQILSITKNTDGTVDFPEVANMYLEVQSKITEFLGTIIESDKSVVFTDLVKLDEGSTATMQKYVLKTTASGLTYQPFSNNSYNGGSWWAGGKCGTCYGANVDRDASTELTKWVTAESRNHIISAPPQHEFYYTNVISTPTLYPHSIGCSGRLIMVSEPVVGYIHNPQLDLITHPLCINQQKMNEYIKKGLLIGQECQLVISGQTVGKVPFNFNYSYDIRIGMAAPRNYTHIVKISYGEVHVRLKTTSTM